MRWVTKKHQAADRWPQERWHQLFSHSIIWRAILCRKYELDSDRLKTTRFYAGYLVGFPNYVALANERLAGRIREALLEATFEDALGDMLPMIREQLERGDHQFNRGLQAGTEDGQRFFRAVEQNLNPYGEDTSTSLKLALSDGLVDFGAQLEV